MSAQIRAGVRHLLWMGLAALLGAPVARAATLPKTEGWIELRSENFRLISNAGERKTEEIALDLEQFRLLLSRLRPGSRLQSPVPVRILVFKGRRSFRPYKRWRSDSDSLLGFFLADQFGNRIAMNAFPAQGSSLPIVYHEFTHFFVRHNFSRLPLWVNEGLAEYYSSIDQPGGDLRIGVPIARHLSWLRANSFIPLDQLLATDEDSALYNEAEKRGGFYAQSWGLIHYLLRSGEVKASALPEFLHRLDEGDTVEAAVGEALGFPLSELEPRLRRYINGKQFEALVLAADSIAPPTAVSKRALTRSEVLVHLGDLLTFSGEERELAEAHFRAAVESDGQCADAWAGLGNLARLQGRYVEAADLLAKAVELDSASAETYVWLADLLLGWSDPDSRAAVGGEGESTGPRVRALLATARRIDPHFEEIYAMMATSYFDQDEPPPAAIAAMTRAASAFPNRPELAYNLVVLYLRANQLKEAERVVEQRLRRRDRSDLVHQAEKEIARTDLIRRSNEAVGKGDYARAARLLRQALEVTTDSTAVTQLTLQVAQLESAAERNRQIGLFNRAVELLNAGRKVEAKQLLDELEPVVTELNLRERIRALRSGLQ